jgi:hypothetical protein
MVTFGTFPLPHALEANEQDSRIIEERLIPSGSVPYRGDETAGGRVITIVGEIREPDPDYYTRLTEICDMQDDVARGLDLEDGSAAINAKLGTVQADWNVEKGLECVAYQATFYETS